MGLALFSRSGWTGDQSVAQVVWIGDQSKLRTGRRPSTVVPALLNMGLSGVLVTHDVGGFSGGLGTGSSALGRVRCHSHRGHTRDCAGKKTTCGTQTPRPAHFQRFAQA